MDNNLEKNEEQELDQQNNNQNEELTKNQKRNLKKKEKKKKQQEQNQQIMQKVEEEIKTKLNLTEEEQTDMELAWCIKQLKLGLHQKMSPEDIKTSQNVLDILESDKIPLIKKRLTMKQTFGDYRKLMKIYK